MKCDGCVQAVTEKFSGIDGVTNVAVHLADQTAIVTADREVSQDELNTTLADTKFKVVMNNKNSTTIMSRLCFCYGSFVLIS